MGKLDPALLTILITAGAGLLTALAQLAVALAGYFRSKANAAILTGNTAKLDENTAITKATAISTDGIVTKLIGVTKDASFAEGQKSEVDKQASIQSAVDAARKNP